MRARDVWESRGPELAAILAGSTLLRLSPWVLAARSACHARCACAEHRTALSHRVQPPATGNPSADEAGAEIDGAGHQMSSHSRILPTLSAGPAAARTYTRPAVC